MLIETYYDGVEIHREEKIIYAKFLQPHQVLATCRAAGGFQDGLSHVFNHQSCEPAGHSRCMAPSLWRDPMAYRQRTCEPYGLPAEACATMGTAANMNNAAFVLETFRDLQETICRHLDDEPAELLRCNFSEIERDPPTVAAVAAMAHLKDKFAWGVLPAACWSEVMGAYAAQVACAVSGDYSRLPDYRERLAPSRTDSANDAFVTLACRAFAMGYADKWRLLDQERKRSMD